MSQIAERTARVAELLEAVRNHPMCGELREARDGFIVIYPAGDFPVDGLQSVVRRGEGRAVALEKLLPVMERHWRESFP